MCTLPDGRTRGDPVFYHIMVSGPRKQKRPGHLIGGRALARWQCYLPART